MAIGVKSKVEEYFDRKNWK